jgi:hypothetical protein
MAIKITDHDLLIELRTEMQNVRNDIKELKDGTATRIQSLEKDKADRHIVDGLQRTVNEDHEVRIRTLESSKGNYFTAMLIYTGVGVAMIGLIIYHLFQS